MKKLAEAEGYKVDQLEPFIFQFGINLKKTGGNLVEVWGLKPDKYPPKMQTEPNIDLLYFNGYCPACNHKEKQHKLRLNSNDFWECEACHLQLTTFVPYAAILQWRGEGKFRQTIG